MDMSLIIMKGIYGFIGADDYLWHDYYIIKFYLYSYALQADLNIYGRVIYFGEMVCDGTYFFIFNINYHHYILQ